MNNVDKSQAKIEIANITISLVPRRKSKAYNKNMQVRPDTDRLIKKHAKGRKIDEVLYDAMIIYANLKEQGIF